MEPNPFENKPQAQALYGNFIQELSSIGLITTEEVKKTSLHIVVPGKSAFLGVHPKKDHLQINIVLDRPLESSRTIKIEQVSKNRYHNLIKVGNASEIDKELLGWIEEAYRRVEQK